MDNSVSSASWDTVWWTIMVVISAINLLAAWFLCIKSIKSGLRDRENSKYFLLLRSLGLIFISVAMYRTIFVSSYPGRIVWFDTMFNSPFIIRCMAACAELSFIGMIAAILLKFSRETMVAGIHKNNRLFYFFLTKSPFIAVGCLLLAQFFAFDGLIRQYLLPFAIEETLWGLAFISITPLVITGLVHLKRINADCSLNRYKVFLIIMAIWCAGYGAFQCFYALPFIHWAHISQDIGKIAPPDALRLAVFDHTVSRDFNTWGGIGFIIWHSGYFSVCSWMSLLFMTAPRKRNKAA